MSVRNVAYEAENKHVKQSLFSRCDNHSHAHPPFPSPSPDDNRASYTLASILQEFLGQRLDPGPGLSPAAS